MRAAAAAVIGYAVGLLPSAEIVARKVDPRSSGSGNPGAANVAALAGKRAGATVFGLDAAKAVVAAALGGRVAGTTGANVAAAAAVVGHCFPANRGFRGGKGVAASFGQMLATFPAYLPVDIALGVLAAKTEFWKSRPVATISATCGLWTVLAAAATRWRAPNLWAARLTVATPLAAAASSVAIIYRFRVEARTPPGPTTETEGDDEPTSQE